MSRLIRYLATTKLWHWLATKIFDEYTFRIKGYPKFPMDEWSAIANAVIHDSPTFQNTVYCFVSRDLYAIGAVLIDKFADSYWSHAGIFINQEFIMHIRQSGVHRHHLINLLREVDCFAVVAIDDVNTFEFNNRVNKFTSASYDIEYNLESKEHLYCSELIYVLLDGIVNRELPTSISMGNVAYTPDDVYRSGRVIYELRS